MRIERLPYCSVGAIIRVPAAENKIKSGAALPSFSPKEK
jgi:hypothetical protein